MQETTKIFVGGGDLTSRKDWLQYADTKTSKSKNLSRMKTTHERTATSRSRR